MYMAVSHLLCQQKHNTEGLHAKFGFRDILLGLDIYLSFFMIFNVFGPPVLDLLTLRATQNKNNVKKQVCA